MFPSSNWIAEHESSVFWTLFVVIFLAVAQWESGRQNRDLIVSAGRRWTRHGVNLLISNGFAILVLRTSPVLAAVAATEWHWGLFQQVAVPYWLQFVVAILVLDLVKYATHRLMHAVSWLWRVHQVHHSDPDFDVSTTWRAHPLEILIMQGSIIGTVFLLALPPLGVFTGEMLALAISFFEHANTSLPPTWERRARRWIITPDVHRIHHSARMEEQWTNLGELLPLWDRLFGTYQDQPEGGVGNLVVGMEGFHHPRSLDFSTILLLPFQHRAPMMGEPKLPEPQMENAPPELPPAVRK